MLMGEYNHTIDAKGRVTIPAKFRSELGDHFVVTRGLENCLSAYSYERWKRIEDNLKNISLTNKAGMKLTRLILGNAIECEVDKMGRILITQTLRSKADLIKDVVLIGQGDRIEIWNKNVWDEYNSKDAFDEMTDEELEKLEGLEL
ncbi:MAG: division/cell wall cluster transcriptional repressor MraZ [Lachnospiraceae bacterium]|nr:division/cell wall cluster transcriptional repressor MraZ [Lachnospiraceae bacterium]